MTETLRILIALGLTLLLVMHRLEASRFGAAEYDEPVRGRRHSILRRIAWYAIGAVGVVAVFRIHPDPMRDLYLLVGDPAGAIGLGVMLAAAGVAQALAFAWLRYKHLRLPEVSQYPGAIVNEVGTAFVDEAVFRGALLGFLVLGGIDPQLAIVIQAIVYALATRLGARGRDRYTFSVVSVIGLVAGWATVTSGGIGAAFFAHAVTRVTMFLTTGHEGQPAPVGTEVEEIEKRRRVPDGWRVVTTRESGRGR